MKLKNILSLVVVLAITGLSAFAGKPTLDRVEPMFWWAGMHNPNLQLMVHGENIATAQASVNYPGVTLRAQTSLDNPNYVFLDLVLAKDVQPGAFAIDFKLKGKTVASYNYELKQREAGSRNREGFNSSDVLYLVMPDRFANGDKSNDVVKGMREDVNRANSLGRHGGDIAGLDQNLDYVIDQGYTAVWLNPLLENDMPANSYHGYAITDFYAIDRHYGTNEEYAAYAKHAKENGIKMIMDMIFNHCGALHPWMKDMPSKDWINNMPEQGIDDIEFTDEAMAGMDQSRFIITSHRKTANLDPYVSKKDKDQLTDGWFVPSMPDLNQRNPYLATYLIQNSIWWIEYAHLAGIRMDTYPYPDKYMMADWNKAVLAEYPDFTIVGEEMAFNPSIVSYWQGEKENKDGYVPYCPSMMDFPIQGAVNAALTEEEGWDNGLMKIFATLGMDFQYENPLDLVIFPDNHDLSRYYSVLNKDFDLWKMGIAIHSTTRGIPQFFYGTETLMEGFEPDGHGYLRADFPGGWEGDKVNAFTGEGLTDLQKEAQAYIKKVLNWRKNATAIHEGKLLHFVPENSIYVYFRYTDNESVMVIVNKNDKAMDIDTDRYAEGLVGYSAGYDVMNSKNINSLDVISVAPKSTTIIELK